MRTIEQKAQAYAEDKATALGLPPNNKFQPMYLNEVKKAIEAAYLAGTKDILSLPLCERLTEEEKEKIRGFYNGETFGELDFIELISCRRILTALLGPDFFKEGGPR